MTDIVKRLRRSVVTGADCSCVANDTNPADLVQAADEIERLQARLAEAERLLREATMLLFDWDANNFDHWGSIVTETKAFLAKVGYDPMTATMRPADSASAVQPERCCLDYPRCDCNSPPEPDDDWLCFQRPAQPKVTP